LQCRSGSIGEDSKNLSRVTHFELELEVDSAAFCRALRGVLRALYRSP
jgi:hypothetical protein